VTQIEQDSSANVSAPLKNLAISSGLVLGLFASAIGVIYVSHLNRGAFDQWQKALAEEDQLNTEWGQLLLEQSALASHSRVERIAIHKLKMRVPAMNDVVLVTAE